MKHRPNSVEPIKAFLDQSEVGLDQTTHESCELVSLLQNGCLPGAENKKDGLRDSVADRGQNRGIGPFGESQIQDKRVPSAFGLRISY
jgi:hypothetical protein